MKNALIALSVFFMTILPVSAGSLKTSYTGKNFTIARQIVINAKDLAPEDNDEIGNIVTKNGGKVLYKFSVKSLVGPAITVKHSNRIKGSNDRNAFQIDVTQVSVKIAYTSPTSLKKAVETLKSIVVTDTYGEKCIRGGKYTWVDEPGDNTVNAKKSHMAGEIRLLNSSLDRMAAGSETELILITSSDWMVESPAIEEFDNTKKLYGTNGFVTCDELKEVISKASARGVKLKIVMQLYGENVPFTEVTGHSIFSPEGMRFLRAALQQWHDICGLDTVYTGQPSEDSIKYKRFDSFLETISPITGIKFYR